MCDNWPGNADCFMLDAQYPHSNFHSDVEPIVRKILRGLLAKNDNDRKFTMSFTGSSNTAGKNKKIYLIPKNPPPPLYIFSKKSFSIRIVSFCDMLWGCCLSLFCNLHMTKKNDPSSFCKFEI